MKWLPMLMDSTHSQSSIFSTMSKMKTVLGTVLIMPSLICFLHAKMKSLGSGSVLLRRLLRIDRFLRNSCLLQRLQVGSELAFPMLYTFLSLENPTKIHFNGLSPIKETLTQMDASWEDSQEYIMESISQKWMFRSRRSGPGNQIDGQSGSTQARFYLSLSHF